MDCAKNSHNKPKTATAPLPPLRSVKVLDQLREHTLLSLQLTSRTGLCQLGSCLHPFPRCASPGNLGQQRSRGISVTAGERAQGFGLHASSGIGGLAVLLRQGAVHWICPAGIGRPRPSRRLPVVLTPDEVVSHPRFSGRRASFVRPASAMERAYPGSVRFATAGQGSGFRSRHDHRAEGKELKGSGLDVTRRLGTQPARAACRDAHGHGG